jgi:hypothetical protein
MQYHQMCETTLDIDDDVLQVLAFWTRLWSIRGGFTAQSRSPTSISLPWQ